MHTITLTNRESLAGNIVAFTFTKPHCSWRAGNHAVFFVPHENADEGGISRPLSIASAPGDDHVLIVSHCPPDGSSFKRALGALSVGSEIEMTDPVGDFVIEDSVSNPLIVAAGIGISAVRAVLRDREQRGVPLALDLQYYASGGNFIFRQELEAMAARHPEFSLQFMEHDVSELGQIKEVEQRLDRKVYMSGVYVQRTDVPDSFDSKADHIAAREEVHLLEAAKKLIGK